MEKRINIRKFIGQSLLVIAVSLFSVWVGVRFGNEGFVMGKPEKYPRYSPQVVSSADITESVERYAQAAADISQKTKMIHDDIYLRRKIDDIALLREIHAEEEKRMERWGNR